MGGYGRATAYTSMLPAATRTAWPPIRDRGEPATLDRDGHIDQARPPHLETLLDGALVGAVRQLVKAVHDAGKRRRRRTRGRILGNAVVGANIRA